MKKLDGAEKTEKQARKDFNKAKQALEKIKKKAPSPKKEAATLDVLKKMLEKLKDEKSKLTALLGTKEVAIKKKGNSKIDAAKIELAIVKTKESIQKVATNQTSVTNRINRVTAQKATAIKAEKQLKKKVADE